jgi:DNA repair protein RadC
MNQGKLELGLNGPGMGKILACEEPQVRLDNCGAAALSDTELLALMLAGGTAPTEAMTMARHIIGEAGSIAALAAWHTTDYQRWTGIGPAKGRQLAAVIEIGRRMMRPRDDAERLLNRPELVMDYFRPTVQGLEVEKFWVLNLNRKNRLKRIVEVTSGTATSSLAHPREVFRTAIREGATGVICVHNHPSGDPAPSAADVQVTRQLREAAKTVDIELLDHVIVGIPANDPNGRGYYSFREAGVI